MEVCGQLHAHAALPPGKDPRYPLYRRLGGPQSRSGRYEKEKNRLPLPEIELRLLGRLIRSLVAIPTELSWLPPSISVVRIQKVLKSTVRGFR
jgi:hypothetical protein